MSKPDKPTASQVNREFREDADRVLGVDDESLRKREADRRGARLKSEGGLKSRLDTFWGYLWLRSAYSDVADPEPDDETHESNMSMVWFGIMVVFALLIVALGWYVLGVRSKDPTTAIKYPSTGTQRSATSGGNTSPASTGGGSDSEAAKPRRWLIVADTPLYGKRPQFTIELKGDGLSGDAVWLEPPGGTGTYEWSGDDVVVKLVQQTTYTPGKTFPQHFEIRMTKQADGSLSGQMLSEFWEYSGEKGLVLKGLQPWPAVGEPK